MFDPQLKAMIDMFPEDSIFSEDMLEDEKDVKLDESNVISLASAIEMLDFDRSAVVLEARRKNRFSIKYVNASHKLMDIMTLQVRALISQVLLSAESDTDLANANAYLLKLRAEVSFHIRKCHQAAILCRDLDMKVFTRVLDLETEWVKMLARLENSGSKINDAKWRERSRNVSLHAPALRDREAFPAIEGEKEMQPISGMSGFGSFTALPAFRPLHEQDRIKSQETRVKSQETREAQLCCAGLRAQGSGKSAALLHSQETRVKSQEGSAKSPDRIDPIDDDIFDDYDNDDTDEGFGGVKPIGGYKPIEMFQPFKAYSPKEFYDLCHPPGKK